MARPKSNNNPFALMDETPSAWKGLIGIASDGFMKFESPYYGVRAGFINLNNAYLKRGLNTIEKIFPVYAPYGHGANDPKVYIDRVSKLTGIPKNKVLSTDDEIYKVGKAIVTHEEGNFWVSTKDFDNGFNDALKAGNFVTAAPIVGGGLIGIIILILILYNG